MNLFIVESALQLLCAFEAIKKNEKPYILYIRLTGRGQNDKHLVSCANFLQLQFSTFILRPTSPQLDIVKNILIWLKLFSKKFETVYFGSYYSGILRLIRIITRHNNAVYLDDGLATLRAQDEIYLYPSKSVNWFTLFDIEPISGQAIEINNFYYLKKYINKNYLI